jgi:phage gp29-like protein
MILDIHGRPIRKVKRPPFDEIAIIKDGMDITRGYVNPDFLLEPQDKVLQLAGGGNYDVYKDMWRDDAIFSSFLQRFTAVISRDYVVNPASKDKKDVMAADFIREWLEVISFDSILAKMLFAVFYGFAVSEVIYENDGQYVTISKVKVRDRNRFRFDGNQQLKLITNLESNGMILPPNKFWYVSFGADHDDEPYGLGLAHQLYWPFFFKKLGDEGWVNYLERYVNPPVVGEYPPGATEEQKNTLEDAALSLNSDAVAIYPTGMILKYLESTRTSSADYDSFLEKMDKRIRNIILAQTATSEGTPGLLGSEEGRTTVKEDVVTSDADLICKSFSENVVKWLCGYNFPDAKPPRVWRDMAEKEELNGRADRDSKLYSIGYRLVESAFKEIYGDGYEVVEVPVSQPPLNFVESEPKDSLNPIFERLDQSLGADMPEALKPLLDFVEKADSLESVKKGLFSFYEKMNTEKIVNSMSNAALLAHLFGQSEVRDGE